MRTRTNCRARLLAAPLLLSVFLPLLAGCGRSDDNKPPAGVTYYTGPMKPKGSATQATPAAPKSAKGSTD